MKIAILKIIYFEANADADADASVIF